MNNKTLKTALKYADNGFSVFPVHRIRDGVCTCYRGASCPSAGKHPAVDGWPELATTDPEQISKWFTGRFTDYNIGIYTGKDLVIFDCDVNEAGKNGQTKLSELEEKYGPLSRGVVQTTGSGGLHVLARIPEAERGKIGRYVTKNPESEWFGLDLLASNSFIVAAPSRSSKGPYEWNAGKAPHMDEVPELSAQWTEYLTSFTGVTQADEKERRAMYTAKAVLNQLPDIDTTWGVDTETFKKIEQALTWIPADGGGNDHAWFKILGALKLAANDQRGFNLACDWSGAISQKTGEPCEQFKNIDDVAFHWSRCSTPEEMTDNDATFTSILWEGKLHGNVNGEYKHFSTANMGLDQIPEFKVATLADVDLPDMAAGKQAIAETELPDEDEINLEYKDLLKTVDGNDHPILKLMDLPGPIGDIARYIESGNPSPQPLFACMAALPLFSTLTQRLYRGDKDLLQTCANIQSIVIGPSSSGKNASIQLAQMILRELGLSDCVGRKASHGNTYHKQVVSHPNKYFPIDEIGFWWQGATAQGDKSQIKSFFLSVFTSSGSDSFIGHEYSDNSKGGSIGEVAYPHVNLYGVVVALFILRRNPKFRWDIYSQINRRSNSIWDFDHHS